MDRREESNTSSMLACNIAERNAVALPHALRRA